MSNAIVSYDKWQEITNIINKNHTFNCYAVCLRKKVWPCNNQQ